MQKNSSSNDEFVQAIDTQILCGGRPDILDREAEWLANIVKEYGMTPNYRSSRGIMDYLFMGIHYKLPVEFFDAENKRFCCGRYVRTEKPSDLLIKLCASTSFQRPVDRPDGQDGWCSHYSIQFGLCGHHWPYGRKQNISYELPAGMQNVYEYGDGLCDFEGIIRHNLQTIKDYIDNGKPIVK